MAQNTNTSSDDNSEMIDGSLEQNSDQLQQSQQDEKAIVKKEEKLPAVLNDLPNTNVDINILMDIKLKVTCQVGTSKMYIRDLLSLGQGSVVELHRLIGEQLDILVNDRLLAKGEVVIINENFGIRLNNILTPQERIQILGPQDE